MAGLTAVADAFFVLVAGAILLVALYVWRKQPAAPPAGGVDVERVLKRVRLPVTKAAKRMRHTWVTFDKKKTRTVPRDAFTQVLQHARIPVSPEEAGALCDIFSARDDADFVLYDAFLTMVLPSKDGPGGAGAGAGAGSDSDSDSEGEVEPQPRRRRTPKD